MNAGFHSESSATVNIFVIHFIGLCVRIKNAINVSTNNTESYNQVSQYISMYHTLHCTAYPWSIFVVQVSTDFNFTNIRSNLKCIANIATCNGIRQAIFCNEKNVKYTKRSIRCTTKNSLPKSMDLHWGPALSLHSLNEQDPNSHVTKYRSQKVLKHDFQHFWSSE